MDGELFEPIEGVVCAVELVKLLLCHIIGFKQLKDFVPLLEKEVLLVLLQ